MHCRSCHATTRCRPYDASAHSASHIDKLPNDPDAAMPNPDSARPPLQRPPVILAGTIIHMPTPLPAGSTPYIVFADTFSDLFYVF
jgi:hypothetical protein